MSQPAPLVVELAPGITAAFTTRVGGVSNTPYDGLNLGLHVGDDPAAVVANRERALAAIGLPLDATVWCEQVHGDRVETVGAAERGRGARSHDDAIAGADGLVTTEAGVGLAVLAADCLPVLLADRRAGVVGAVHAGWRGLAGGVVQVALGTMLDAGARREDVVAVVGPAIGPCCYEVGKDVHEAVTSAVHGASSRTRTGTLAVDLAAGVRRVLAAEGVTAVRAVGGCTAHQRGLFFSHRREGVTGRIAGIVWRAA